MRIIVCLDGSDYALASLPIVRELLQAGGGRIEVELLRVLDPGEVEDRLPKPPGHEGLDVVEASGADPTEAFRLEAERRASYDEQMMQTRARLTQRLEDEARQGLHAALAGLGAPGEIAVLSSPNPAEAIRRHARERGAALVVLATHSRGPLPALLLGSTAQAVLKPGDLPVLLAHPGGASGPAR